MQEFISNKEHLNFIPSLIWTEFFHIIYQLIESCTEMEVLTSVYLFYFAIWLQFARKNKDKAVTVHRDAICLLNLAWHLLDTQSNKRNCINIHQQRSQPQCRVWSIICYFYNDNSDSSALMIPQYIAWLIFYLYVYNLFFHFMSCLSFVPKIWK